MQRLCLKFSLLLLFSFFFVFLLLFLSNVALHYRATATTIATATATGQAGATATALILGRRLLHNDRCGTRWWRHIYHLNTCAMIHLWTMCICLYLLFYTSPDRVDGRCCTLHGPFYTTCNARSLYYSFYSCQSR